MRSVRAIMDPMVAFTTPPDEVEANWLVLRVTFVSLSVPSLFVTPALCLTVENIRTSRGKANECL